MPLKIARRPQAPKDGGKAGQRRRTIQIRDRRSHLIEQFAPYWMYDLTGRSPRSQMRIIGLIKDPTQLGGAPNMRRTPIDPIEQELDWDVYNANTAFAGLSDIWMVSALAGVVDRLMRRSSAPNSLDVKILAKGGLTVDDVHTRAKAESPCEWWCHLCDPSIEQLADWEIKLLQASPRVSPPKPRRARVRTRAGVEVDARDLKPTNWRSESPGFTVSPTLTCGCKGTICKCAVRQKAAVRKEITKRRERSRRNRTFG